MNVHKNARLTPQGRALLVHRVRQQGRRVRDAAAAAGLSERPQFQFSEAISMSISCQDAAEVDRYWNALIANGGAEGRCGWLKDRFGVSWQVVPNGLAALLSDPDPTRVGRAAKAMMGMKKLDLAAMRAAAERDA